MMGIGPVDKNEIDKAMADLKDYEKAKVEVVKHHLRRFYKYNSDELETLTIAETKYLTKGNGMIYIAFTDQEDITDIYVRKADCRQDDVILRTHVPPQFFKQFMCLNRICADRRQLDKNFKTQIRLINP